MRYSPSIEWEHRCASNLSSIEISRFIMQELHNLFRLFWLDWRIWPETNFRAARAWITSIAPSPEGGKETVAQAFVCVYLEKKVALHHFSFFNKIGGIVFCFHSTNDDVGPALGEIRPVTGSCNRLSSAKMSLGEKVVTGSRWTSWTWSDMTAIYWLRLRASSVTIHKRLELSWAFERPNWLTIRAKALIDGIITS